MRHGEAKAREKLLSCARACEVNDVGLACGLPGTPIGVDESTLDKELLKAASSYVNAVVGPNINGDRC